MNKTTEIRTGIVERLAYRGFGITHLEGKVVFLPFTAPGDVVTYRITRDQGTYATGSVERLLRSSTERTEALCQAFGRCGGCHLQHVVYEEQVRWKERWVHDALERTAGIRDAVVLPALRCPQPFGYRNKASLHVRGSRLGFVARGTNKVVNIDCCPVLSPLVERALRGLGAWLRGQGEPKESFRIGVRAGSDDHGLIVLHTKSSKLSGIQALQEELQDFRIVHGDSRATVVYDVESVRFRVSPEAFFQVNSLQHHQMTAALREAVGTGVCLVDGHSGVGWPTLCLAERFEKLIATEISRTARELARANAEAAGIGNVAFRRGTLHSLSTRGVLDCRPDVVILDPPRSGLRGQDLDAVLRLVPRRIVYVSCDPATLARDIRRLVARGYSLDQVQPIDLFPQTYHVETIAVMNRD